MKPASEGVPRKNSATFTSHKVFFLTCWRILLSENSIALNTKRHQMVFLRQEKKNECVRSRNNFKGRKVANGGGVTGLWSQQRVWTLHGLDPGLAPGRWQKPEQKRRSLLCGISAWESEPHPQWCCWEPGSSSIVQKHSSRDAALSGQKTFAEDFLWNRLLLILKIPQSWYFSHASCQS